MDWRVIVERVISQAIRGFCLPREVSIALGNFIHNEIAARREQFRNDRDPEDPDQFRVFMRYATETHWHIFFLRVNDARATNRLFVETIDYRKRAIS